MPPESDTNSILSALLSKMSHIEAQLQDLSTIKEQLIDLSTIKPQLTALDARLSETSAALGASILDLKARQDGLEGRVGALEVGGPPGRQLGLERMEARLEALERVGLNSELIIFGVRESPSEVLRDILSNIAAVIGVEVIPGHITACFRIPAKGSRPRPIIVKLSSSEVRNRWIDGKRAKGALNGAEVTGLVPGVIEINERLSARTREVLGEARRAVGEGRLLRAWVRNGLIHVRRNVNTSPIRLRDREHLRTLIVEAPPPVAPVGVVAGPSSGYAALPVAPAGAVSLSGLPGSQHTSSNSLPAAAVLPHRGAPPDPSRAPPAGVPLHIKNIKN